MPPGIKPYSDYKPSGVEWLDDVPAHWEVRPNRAIFVEVNERNHSEEQMLSVTITNGVIRQQALLEDSSKKDASRLDKSAYKLVQFGDIAYNKMRAWQGAVGMSKYRGIVSPAYVVQRPCDGAVSRYFHYLMRTPAFTIEAERWSYGITSDMWSLRPEHFKMIYSCVPPLAEQNAIARYLDHVDGRIGRCIDARERLVGLLEEKRRAVIHRAVTRGLDPNVRLKPSGVEWLGDVPAHWGVRPNRAIFVEVNERNHSEEQMLSVTITNGVIRQQALLEDSSKKDASRLDKSAYKLVQFGDIAYNKMRAWQGAVGMSKYRGIVSPAYVVQRPCDGAVSRYFHYLMRTPAFMIEAERWSYGITSDMWSLRPEHFKMIYSCVPPLAEQAAIAAHLDKATAAIDAAVACARRQVELLREYRARLIADVVTGKLDVREAAANLPDDITVAVDSDETDFSGAEA